MFNSMSDDMQRKKLAKLGQVIVKKAYQLEPSEKIINEFFREIQKIKRIQNGNGV